MYLFRIFKIDLGDLFKVRILFCFNKIILKKCFKEVRVVFFVLDVNIVVKEIFIYYIVFYKVNILFLFIGRC